MLFALSNPVKNITLDDGVVISWTVGATFVFIEDTIRNQKRAYIALLGLAFALLSLGVLFVSNFDEMSLLFQLTFGIAFF